MNTNYKIGLLAGAFFLGITFSAFALAPKNFEQAKKIAHFIWNDHRETFYCGCYYEIAGKVNLSSCGYKKKVSAGKIAQKISWEHVVPISRLAGHRACWKEDLCILNNGQPYRGRKCCRKIDPQFRQMEADLHNLVPVIYEVNLRRKNYRFAEFPLDHSKCKFHFNRCPIIIDERYGLVEPRDEIKGMIARIHLHLSQKYGFLLSNYEQRLFFHWNERFPPTTWERMWDQKVSWFQGDHNEFIYQSTLNYPYPAF